MFIDGTYLFYIDEVDRIVANNYANNGSIIRLDAKADGDKPVDVYTVGGLQVKAGVRKADALRGLPKGVYVVDGEKYVK